MTAAIIAELQRAIVQRTPVVMATVVDSERSVPRRPGSKMLVYPDGRIVGSIGGGEMESRVIARALELFDSGQPTRISYELIDPTSGDPGLCGGTVELYLEPHLPESTLLLAGSGPLADALAEVGVWVGFSAVTAADAERADQPIDEFTRVLVASDDGEFIAATLLQLVQSAAPYFSTACTDETWQTARGRLLAGGIGASDLARIRRPLLGGPQREPAEAALLMLADVVAFERGAG